VGALSKSSKCVTTIPDGYGVGGLEITYVPPGRGIAGNNRKDEAAPSEDQLWRFGCAACLVACSFELDAAPLIAVLVLERTIPQGPHHSTQEKPQ
jgi:hypothetical protein